MPGVDLPTFPPNAMADSPHIVHVEDDPTDARLFERAVKAASPGTRLRWYRDGQSALDEIDRLTDPAFVLPAVVVIDIKLPKIGGFDLLRRIRHQEDTSAVPVVMLTSSTQEADIERAYAERVNSFISKPPTYGELKEMVATFIPYWLTYNRRILAFSDPARSLTNLEGGGRLTSPTP